MCENKGQLLGMTTCLALTVGLQFWSREPVIVQAGLAIIIRDLFAALYTIVSLNHELTLEYHKSYLDQHLPLYLLEEDVRYQQVL